MFSPKLLKPFSTDDMQRLRNFHADAVATRIKRGEDHEPIIEKGMERIQDLYEMLVSSLPDRDGEFGTVDRSAFTISDTQWEALEIMQKMYVAKVVGPGEWVFNHDPDAKTAFRNMRIHLEKNRS